MCITKTKEKLVRSDGQNNTEGLRVTVFLEGRIVPKECRRFSHVGAFGQAKRAIVHAARTGHFALVKKMSTDIAFRHRAKI